MLTTNIQLCINTMLWEREHGRKPFIHELSNDAQIAFGKKVFEYADYRDKHYPSMRDSVVYESCLNDHGFAVDNIRLEYLREAEKVVSRLGNGALKMWVGCMKQERGFYRRIPNNTISEGQ